MHAILYRGQTRKFGDKVRMDGRKLPGIWVYGGVARVPVRTPSSMEAQTMNPFKST